MPLHGDLHFSMQWSWLSKPEIFMILFYNFFFMFFFFYDLRFIHICVPPGMRRSQVMAMYLCNTCTATTESSLVLKSDATPVLLLLGTKVGVSGEEG